MAIQMRRGNYADFDASRMVAGEFGVCLDNGYVFVTLSAGNCVKLGTADTIDEALQQALDYVNQCNAVLEETKTVRDNTSGYEELARTSADNAEESYQSTLSIKADIDEAIEQTVPEFEMDWETGELKYTGNAFTLYTDDSGMLHWALD